MEDKKFYRTLSILFFIVFIILKIISLFVKSDMWWDSSVYIGMGKYTYSLGKSGLWEASRPIVWPLILGFFWKIGLDYVFFGKMVTVLFSIGSVIFTYLIVLTVFGKKEAFYTSLFLAFSPTFFLFNNIPFSEIPSMFFLLLGLYLLIKNQQNFAGFFFGLSFMTRFFQIFIIIPIAISYLYVAYKKKQSRLPSSFFIWFFVPIIPYLLINYIMYNSPFYPFILQAFMTKYTGWVYYKPLYFYFTGLIMENILVLFFIIGLWYINKEKKFEKKIFLFVSIFTFALYSFARHKEMRFLIPLFPFLYAVASHGIVSLANIFKKNSKIITMLLIIIWAAQTIPQTRFDKYEDNLGLFYNYVSKANPTGLWISNPSFVLFSNQKVEELIYYPLYDSSKVKEIQQKVSNAKTVLINSCDILPCPPDDTTCDLETNNLLKGLKNNFHLLFDSDIKGCRYYIFEK